ncbi:MAG: histidine phosphatase family protein [Saprospiraceae bacterium]|nr:histidine phosphatase family protein [Saprospiraceae bacterium]
MNRITIFFSALLLIGALAPACDKNAPSPIVHTPAERDTLVVNAPDTATVFILVRHAEKAATGGNDPDLSADGQLRAAELARMLKEAPVAAVLASNYKRTRQTVETVAADHGLTVQLYDPNAQAALSKIWPQQFAGQTVLVVGHSNTVPQLVNLLTGTTNFAQLPDEQYDNLYIVTVYRHSPARVLHLKYGKAT